MTHTHQSKLQAGRKALQDRYAGDCRLSLLEATQAPAGPGSAAGPPKGAQSQVPSLMGAT